MYRDLTYRAKGACRQRPAVSGRPQREGTQREGTQRGPPDDHPPKGARFVIQTVGGT